MPLTVSAALLQRAPAWLERAPHPHAADADTFWVSSGSLSFADTLWNPELFSKATPNGEIERIWMRELTVKEKGKEGEGEERIRMRKLTVTDVGRERERSITR